MDCKALTSVTIPSSVTAIENKAFYSAGTSKFYCLAKTPPAIHDIFLSPVSAYVPKESLSQYQTAEHWKDMELHPLELLIAPSSQSLKAGEKLKLEGVFEPSHLTIKWTSSEKSVATVDNTGKVHAKGGGKTTITLSCEEVDGLTATRVIDVIQPVKSVALSPESKKLLIGAEFTLTPIFTPSNASNKAVKWTSSEPTVAEVVNGKVTAKGKGNAAIIVRTVDGGFEATCLVEVKGEPSTPTPVVDTDNATLRIAPNPTSSFIMVTGLSERTTAYIYSLEGTLLRVLELDRNGRIDVRDLKSGAYLLRVKGRSMRFMKK